MHRATIFSNAFILIWLFFLILVLVNLSERIEAEFHFVLLFSFCSSYLMIKCLEHPIRAVNFILMFSIELFLTLVMLWLFDDLNVIILRLTVKTFWHELCSDAVEAIDKAFGVSSLCALAWADQPLIQIFATTDSHHLLLQVEISCGQNWLQLALAVVIT